MFYWLFRRMLLNFHVFVKFSVFLSLLISRFIPLLAEETTWYDFTFLEFAKTCFVAKHVIYPRMCILEKNVIYFVGQNVLYMSVRFICTTVLLKFTVFLLIHCLDNLFKVKNEMLKVSNYYCVAIYFSFSSFIVFALFKCSDVWMHTYLQLFYLLDVLIPLSLHNDLLCLLCVCVCYFQVKVWCNCVGYNYS